MELKQETVASIFRNACRQFSNKPAYSVKLNGNWENITYSQVYQLVKDSATALWKLGFRRGDVISILSENRPEWNICDYAVTGPGMICTPVYPTLTADQAAYILRHASAGLVFASTAEQAEKIISVKDQLPNLKYLVVFDEYDFPADQNWIMSYDAFRSLADKDAASFVFKFDEELEKTAENDVFTYIYTSGTTGQPKGVILTHKNIASNVLAALKALSISDSDRFLSFLPLSHSLERMAGHITPFRVGAMVAFAEGVNEVQDNLKEVKPTVVISVPRLFEKIFDRINLGIARAPALRRRIFNWSVSVGGEVSSNYRQFGSKPSGMVALKYAIAFKLVFSKLAQALGGNIRYFVSGGAPLNREIGEFFDAAGIAILEGYGLTETSPVTNVNRLERYKFGTVGPAIDQVEVRLSDDREIQVKGPNVMQGYFRNDDATAHAFTPDGWFRTGDRGEIDSDGYLKITGRIKDLIVTSGGKNIAPAHVEQALMQSPYISQVVIIGDKRNYLTALIVPNMDELSRIAAEKNIRHDSIDEMIHHFEIVNFMENQMENLQQDLARFEQIKRFTLMPAEFTIQDGEITPSLKIRRNVIEKKYADIIDKMYK